VGYGDARRWFSRLQVFRSRPYSELCLEKNPGEPQLGVWSEIREMTCFFGAPDIVNIANVNPKTAFGVASLPT
jgi:hypothetical protein